MKRRDADESNPLLRGEAATEELGMHESAQFGTSFHERGLDLFVDEIEDIMLIKVLVKLGQISEQAIEAGWSRSRKFFGR
jgi:hypothetical protein